VLETISEKKIQHTSDSSTADYYVADVAGANDYYSFGMLMPSRSYSAGSYRYGFNGKEDDNEVKGNGNQIDYGFRIFNPRVGRFLSVDPLSRSYPQLSTFQFSSNSPIASIDLDGNETKYYVINMLEASGASGLKLPARMSVLEDKAKESGKSNDETVFAIFSTKKFVGTDHKVHTTTVLLETVHIPAPPEKEGLFARIIHGLLSGDESKTEKKAMSFMEVVQMGTQLIIISCLKPLLAVKSLI
jgi:RHS repeat-associated protein